MEGKRNARMGPSHLITVQLFTTVISQILQQVASNVAQECVVTMPFNACNCNQNPSCLHMHFLELVGVKSRRAAHHKKQEKARNYGIYHTYIVVRAYICVT
jgi:hypothetical protein